MHAVTFYRYKMYHIFGHIHYDISYFKTKQVVDYQSFFFIYYLKSWFTVQNRALNKTNILNSRILNKARFI